tara:strand:- start:1169 stop:1627 length:459 start_codon:yes stop_codon:yes gene_type:complete
MDPITDPILKAVLEYGVAGLFLLYMVITKHQDQKRFDSMREKYESRVLKMTETNKDEQDSLRTRYENVIAEYNTQIKTYSNERVEAREERQIQIKTYSDEREAARKASADAKKEIDNVLRDIKKEVSENGKSIAAIQAQLQGWTMRLQSMTS